MIETNDEVYVVFHEPWSIHNRGRQMHDYKIWLDDQYDLTLLRTFEVRAGLHPLSKYFHEMVRFLGYYSPDQMARWSRETERWEIYEVEKRDLLE